MSTNKIVVILTIVLNVVLAIILACDVAMLSTLASLAVILFACLSISLLISIRSKGLIPDSIIKSVKELDVTKLYIPAIASQVFLILVALLNGWVITGFVEIAALVAGYYLRKAVLEANV